MFVNPALLFGRFNHSKTNPVFDAAAGIKKLNFSQYLRLAGIKRVNPNQRCIADCLD
jgi:hypothetical protein